jgi:hypothetical protein
MVKPCDPIAHRVTLAVLVRESGSEEGDMSKGGKAKADPLEVLRTVARDVRSTPYRGQSNDQVQKPPAKNTTK